MALDRTHGPEDAEALFAAWAARADGGEDARFEDLLEAHPELTSELNKLHEDWKLFAPLLGRAVPGRLAEGSGIVLAPLAGQAREDAEAPPKELIERLGIQVPDAGRYRFRAILGRGGGGVVLKVWDTKLNRALAMKVVLGRDEERPDGSTPRVDSRTLTRFVDEARIASQLGHPGIVPVHELGTDESGRAYFTMKLVKGEDLSKVIERARAGQEGWNRTQLLNVLLRVCESLAFAHERGVIHRDLKPANVMVGRHGEVYVMDWGLARVVGEEDRHDVRIRTPAEESVLMTVRGRHAAKAGDELLYTMEGDVVGTPAYMPPEQAAGRLESMGPRSDVYAAGAMLYHVLTGRMPYVAPGEHPSSFEIWQRVKQGAPPPIDSISSDAPHELTAVCEKAMAREPADRYADMHALAADLRAYLEGRVVSAHEAGAWAEARKWVLRNRGWAASIAAASLAVVLGLSGVAAVQARARSSLDLRSDLVRAPYLEREFELLWPESDRTLAAMDIWIEQARALVARRDVHQHRLRELESQAQPVPDDELAALRARHPLARELEDLRIQEHARRDELRGIESELLRVRTSIEALEAAKDTIDAEVQRSLDGLIEQRRWLMAGETGVGAGLEELLARQDQVQSSIEQLRVWRFASPVLQWEHQVLERTLAAIDRIDGNEAGLLAQVLARKEWVTTLDRLTLEACAEQWRQTCAAVAADGSPYRALRLEPVRGLIPLGPDPDSGLQEFGHPRSGSVPARDPRTGQLSRDATTGLIFVLIPPGRFLMGAQSSDAQQAGFDPDARSEEAPPHEVELSAYFLSKFELTQGQWARLNGLNDRNVPADSRDLPAGGISWESAVKALAHHGLELPTEAQWEYAARAGRQGAWPWGTEERCVSGYANLADKTVLDLDLRWPQAWGMDWLDDGHARGAPVGSYGANRFGLHDVIGNVWEWCQDPSASYGAPRRPDNGLLLGGDATRMPARGGSFVNNPPFARVSIRDRRPPRYESDDHGLRPIVTWNHP